MDNAAPVKPKKKFQMPAFLQKIDFKDNKVRIALIVILVVVLVVFLKYRQSKQGDEKFSLFPSKKKEKAKSKKGKKSKKSKKSKRGRKAISSADEEEEDYDNELEDNYDDSDSDSDSDEDIGRSSISAALRADAEELYGLVHEGLAKGMQQEDFERVAGDLADEYSFIELKQMYNSYIDRNLDPMREIKMTDYIRILQKEDEGDEY